MNLVQIGESIYNLDYLLKVTEEAEERPLLHDLPADQIQRRTPEPRKLLRLHFTDGKSVALDEARSAAFRGYLASGIPFRTL